MRTGKWQGQPGPGLKEGDTLLFLSLPLPPGRGEPAPGPWPLPRTPRPAQELQSLLPSSGSTESSPCR